MFVVRTPFLQICNLTVRNKYPNPLSTLGVHVNHGGAAGVLRLDDDGADAGRRPEPSDGDRATDGAEAARAHGGQAAGGAAPGGGRAQVSLVCNT